MSTKCQEKLQNDFCKSHTSRTEKEINRICPSKLTKRELEDLYFVLLDNNIVLKKTVNAQDDKIRCLTTKVLRLTAIQKNGLSKEQNSCCISTKAAIEEQNNTLAELRNANEQMTEKIRSLNSRICSAKQFLRKTSAQPISQKFSAIERSSKATSNTSLATIKETEQNINKANIATSTTALHVREFDQKLTKMVSCECHIIGKPPAGDKATTSETLNESPERLCNENKCRTEMEELKWKIARLQEELKATHEEYVARISELEARVLGHRSGSVAAQAQRASSEERLRRTRMELAESKALSDELAVQLSVEKRRVDELGTQLKSARLSGDVASTLAQQLSHERLSRPKVCSKSDDVLSTYAAISRTAAKTEVAGADKQRASISDSARAPDEGRPSDDSGYTDNKDDKNLELLEIIARLQEQLDEIRRSAPAQAPDNQKSQVKPRSSEFESSVQSIDEADVPVMRNVRDYKCVIVDPAKKTILEIEHVNKDGGDAAAHTTELTQTAPTLEPSMPAAVRSVVSAPGARTDEPPKAATSIGTETQSKFPFVEQLLSDEDITPVPTKPRPAKEKKTDFQDDERDVREISHRRPTPYMTRPRSHGLLSQQIPGPIPTEKTRLATKPRRKSLQQPATIKEHTQEYSAAEDANNKSPCKPYSQAYQDNGSHVIKEHTSHYIEPSVITQPKDEHETSIDVTEIRPTELNRLDVCEKYARVCTCPKLVPKDVSTFRSCSGTQHDSPVSSTQSPTAASKFPAHTVSRAQETTMPNLKDGTCSPVEDIEASTFQDTGTSDKPKTRVSGSRPGSPGTEDPNLNIFQPARTAVLPKQPTSDVGNAPDLSSMNPERRATKQIFLSQAYINPLPVNENPTVSGFHEPRTSIHNPKMLRVQEPRASIRDHETQQLQERRSYQESEFLRSQDRPSIHASAIHPEMLKPQAPSMQHLSGPENQTDPSKLQPVRSALLGRRTSRRNSRVPNVQECLPQAQLMSRAELARASLPLTYSISGSAEVELRAQPSTEPDHTDYDISEIADSPCSYFKYASRSTSPGEQQLTSTYTDSYTPPGEYACLSEGEVPTKADRRLSAGEKPVNSNAREPLPGEQLSTAEQMEATLRAISEELRRCKLLLQSKAGEKYSKSPSCEVALKKCPASAEIAPRPRDKCIFTLHIGTVVLSDVAVVQSRDLSLMLTWQFYQQHAAMTRLRPGRVLHIDYSTEYDLPMTSNLLNYLKYEELPIVICEVDKPGRPFARCALPLRDALLHVNRRADMSLALVRGGGGGQFGVEDGLGSRDEMGVVDLWCMLRVDVDEPAINAETPTGSNKTTDLRLMNDMFPSVGAARMSSDLDTRVEQRRAPSYNDAPEEYRMYNFPSSTQALDSSHDYYASPDVAKAQERDQFGNPKFGSTDSNLKDAALADSDWSTSPRPLNNTRRAIQKERELREREESFSQLPSHMRLSSASAKAMAARQQFLEDVGSRQSRSSMYDVLDEQWNKPTKVTPEQDTTGTLADMRKTSLSKRDSKLGRDEAKKSVTIGPNYENRTTKDYYEGFPDGKAACPRFHITVQWLALNEEWSGARRGAARLYVAYSFLGRGGAQLESASKLARHPTKCHYNDTKTFLLNDTDLPVLGHMAKCRSRPGAEHNSTDCITFSVVSEPAPDPLGLDNCEDVGYAYLYLGDLLAYSTGDTYTEVLPVRAPPPGDAVCGVLSVRVDGLSVARRCAMLSHSDGATAY